MVSKRSDLYRDTQVEAMMAILELSNWTVGLLLDHEWQESWLLHKIVGSWASYKTDINNKNSW